MRESPPRVLNPHTSRATCQRTQFYLAFPRTQSPLCAPHACAPQLCFFDVPSSCAFLSVRSPIFLLIPATAVPVNYLLWWKPSALTVDSTPPLPRQVSAPISLLAHTLASRSSSTSSALGSTGSYAYMKSMWNLRPGRRSFTCSLVPLESSATVAMRHSLSPSLLSFRSLVWQIRAEVTVSRLGITP